jgi:hypothetical protein
MPSAPATSDPAARTVDEQCVELICNDPDLLAAEFDAIIAAEWPQPPPDRPARGAASGHPGNGAARRPAQPVRDPVAPPRRPGTGGWARQRSPPFRHPTHHRQKGS